MERNIKTLILGKTYKDRDGLEVTIVKELPKEYREQFLGEFIRRIDKYNAVLDRWESIETKEQRAYHSNGGWGYIPNHLDLIN